MICKICRKDGPVTGRMMCKACYYREWRAGTLNQHELPEARTVADRILSKIEKDDKTGCWNWTGHGRPDGYGLIWHNNRAARAHRVAYAEFKCELAADDVVCHTCDNRRCVNPGHLFVGTRGDNNRDAKAKGRNAYCMRNGHAKLTPDQVQFIRLNVELSQSELARRLGVNQSTVSRIAAGLRRQKTTLAPDQLNVQSSVPD